VSTTPGPGSAAREYKEIVAGITAAADELRAHDLAVAAALARRLVDLDAAMVRAGERAALSRLGVALHWEAALDALWAESWMTLRPLPEPDLSADPAALDALDTEVEQRSADLQDAVRRRRFGLPRR
jgi:hypothetical protein